MHTGKDLDRNIIKAAELSCPADKHTPGIRPVQQPWHDTEKGGKGATFSEQKGAAALLRWKAHTQLLLKFHFSFPYYGALLYTELKSDVFHRKAQHLGELLLS